MEESFRNMKNKILSFIIYKDNFLALRNNSNPGHGGIFGSQ